MCVCVHKSLEGRVGKLYRKFVFSKVNGQPGYREDWILNTFLFFLLQIQLHLCCTILFEISNAKTTLSSFFLSFQRVCMLPI